jgi:peptidoglycan/LPS O-acetylase OafA/YrhL
MSSLQGMTFLGICRVVRSSVAGAARIPELDAARGVLAAVVVCSHVCVAFGSTCMDVPALAAVLLFFVMSGFVLARAYDGKPFTFMARRLVRLWPLYAACVLAGHIVAGTVPPLREFAMSWGNNFYLWVDPPAWSLRYEVWAIPAFPLLFLAARRSPWACPALAGLAFLAMALVDFRFMFAGALIAGVASASLNPRFSMNIPAAALWLGKISYSLYLTHWIVFAAARQVAGAWGVLAALPLAVAIAWAAWWSVERPSVALSRRIVPFGIAPRWRRWLPAITPSAVP